MFRKLLTFAGLALFTGAGLRADFSYQETTRITGGSLVAMLKMMGVFSKQARQLGEPMNSTVAIKGDRMVHRDVNHATIIDLASETFTSVDLQKKTYTVMTFAEMKQAMEQAAQKMQQQKNGNQADMKFKVSIDATGKKKDINGFNATERVIKMEMEGTDKKSGQSGSMVVIADSWIAPNVAGYKEVQAFSRKMAEKIAWTPNGNMFMVRPDVMQGMAEVNKESAKLEGIPVFQTVTMGAEGTAPVDASSTAGTTPAPQPAADKPTVGGALGSALGGRFGLGRKKQQDPPPSSTASGDPAATGSLIEMTTESSGFSNNSVDPSQFEVPAGFKKVEADLKRGMQ